MTATSPTSADREFRGGRRPAPKLVGHDVHERPDGGRGAQVVVSALLMAEAAASALCAVARRLPPWVAEEVAERGESLVRHPTLHLPQLRDGGSLGVLSPS